MKIYYRTNPNLFRSFHMISYSTEIDMKIRIANLISHNINAVCGVQ